MGVCALPLFLGVESILPQKAAARVAAQRALAVNEVVRFPGSVGPPTNPFEYWTGPPIDLYEYRWRRALLHVCVVHVCPFWGWRGYNGRDLHPIHRYRWWCGLLKGGGVSNDAR